jgi:hypothetical protein
MKQTAGTPKAPRNLPDRPRVQAVTPPTAQLSLRARSSYVSSPFSYRTPQRGRGRETSCAMDHEQWQLLALFGPGAMHSLSPVCAPNRTLTTAPQRSQFMNMRPSPRPDRARKFLEKGVKWVAPDHARCVPSTPAAPSARKQVEDEPRGSEPPADDTTACATVGGGASLAPSALACEIATRACYVIAGHRPQSESGT